MKKKCVCVWSLLLAMLTVTACSSEQNEDVITKGKTGTFELKINFEAASQVTAANQVSRASSAIPTTGWSDIKQVQFILYDVASGKIAFSAIGTPAGGGSEDSKVYTYATVPVGTYTLVALANAQSKTDDVTTYASATPLPLTVANVFNRTVGDLSIGHKSGGWGTAIVPSTVSKLTPHVPPSEIFMGYKTNVEIKTNALAAATIKLKREVSLMRVRVDQTTNGEVASKVDFTNAKAAVMLYNLPDRMGIKEGDSGGIGATSTATNALSVAGAFSTTKDKYLDGNYTSWKEVIVFPNNGGRANNSTTTGEAAKKYFIVLCGIAKEGHEYAGGDPATAGAPVFWYGQINEVFTPNVIREVNLLLKTGGSPIPPPGIVEYGGLDITVGIPEPWNSKIVFSTIEM